MGVGNEKWGPEEARRGVEYPLRGARVVQVTLALIRRSLIRAIESPIGQGVPISRDFSIKYCHFLLEIVRQRATHIFQINLKRAPISD